MRYLSLVTSQLQHPAVHTRKCKFQHGYVQIYTDMTASLIGSHAAKL